METATQEIALSKTILNPDTDFDTNTIVGLEGRYRYCHTRCHMCNRIYVLDIYISGCAIKQCYGSWWTVPRHTIPANLCNTPCPDCMPRKNGHDTKKHKKTEPIRLPGLEAVEHYQQRNKKHETPPPKTAPT